MSLPQTHVFDPKLDPKLERVVDVPRELVWKAWTVPQHLMPWFCPLPWKTLECEIDLRPGGKFYTVMQSPEGEKHPDTGCYLDIIPNERLVWTGALLPGYRPADTQSAPFVFTAMLSLEAQGAGTKYTAVVMHSSEDGRKQHEAMGFSQGWSAVLDQLVAYVKKWM